jgi:ElaB/YqjD/DUF883 family membrane-anchored ribosome-binding protein
MVDTTQNTSSSSSVTRDATQRGAPAGDVRSGHMADTATIRGTASSLSNIDVRAAMRDLQDRSRVYIAESDRYIRANPYGAVLGAMGVGFILGFMARRSWS